MRLRLRGIIRISRRPEFYSVMKAQLGDQQRIVLFAITMRCSALMRSIALGYALRERRATY